jgi:hypothetical protein
MSNHHPLSTRDHRHLRVKTERSAALGDNQMCCVTFPEEFRRVQAHYPIVFQLSADRERFSALALFGFQDGENLFIRDPDWDAHYVPLAMNIQPFLVGRPSGEGGESQIHVDLAHPRISETDGIRILDDDGLPTPLLEAYNDRLGQLQAGYEGSGGFMEALKRHDLLEPFALEVTLEDGSSNRLVGFHTINEDRIRSLDAGTLAELQAAGYLMPIFMVLASLANLNDLVARKNAAVRNAG